MEFRHERFPMPPEANVERVIGDASAVRYAMGGATIFKSLEACLGELGRGWPRSPADPRLGLRGRAGHPLSVVRDAVQRLRRGHRSRQHRLVPIGADGRRVHHRSVAAPDGLRRPAIRPGDRPLGPDPPQRGRASGRWLSELRRVARPGAAGVPLGIGAHPVRLHWLSAEAVPAAPGAGVSAISRGIRRSTGSSASHDYYRAAFHSRDYIVSRWTEYFEVVAIIDAIAAVQDFVVLEAPRGLGRLLRCGGKGRWQPDWRFGQMATGQLRDEPVQVGITRDVQDAPLVTMEVRHRDLRPAKARLLAADRVQALDRVRQRAIGLTRFRWEVVQRQAKIQDRPQCPPISPENIEPEGKSRASECRKPDAQPLRHGAGGGKVRRPNRIELRIGSQCCG